MEASNRVMEDYVICRICSGHVKVHDTYRGICQMCIVRALDNNEILRELKWKREPLAEGVTPAKTVLPEVKWKTM